jgi:hypothetical protein
MEANGLRRRAAGLLEQAKNERDPAVHRAIMRLVSAFLVRARELDGEKKLN